MAPPGRAGANKPGRANPVAAPIINFGEIRAPPTWQGIVALNSLLKPLRCEGAPARASPAWRAARDPSLLPARAGLFGAAMGGRYQPARIVIFFSFLVISTGFGNRTRSTPFSNFASTLSESGSYGSVTLRLNRP
jgi:hypothetical protein